MAKVTQPQDQGADQSWEYRVTGCHRGWLIRLETWKLRKSSQPTRPMTVFSVEPLKEAPRTPSCHGPASLLVLGQSVPLRSLWAPRRRLPQSWPRPLGRFRAPDRRKPCVANAQHRSSPTAHLRAQEIWAHQPMNLPSSLETYLLYPVIRYSLSWLSGCPVPPGPGDQA